MSLDKDNKPIRGFGQDRTTLRGYSGNIIKQYGTRLIKAFWNNKYWAILFHIVDTQGPILLGLNAMRKFGLFTKHPRISIETVDLFASKQNQTRCEERRQLQDKVQLDQQLRYSAIGQLTTLRYQQEEGMLTKSTLIIRYQFPFQKDGALLCHCRIDS